MKTPSAVSAGKKRMDSMVNPSGESYESNDSTKEEAGETADEVDAETEASQIMDGIADNPDVCHALYAMLKEKYSGKEKPTDEKAAPKTKTESEPEFTAEGMD
jgi:hypothetical protein